MNKRIYELSLMAFLIGSILFCCPVVGMSEEELQMVDPSILGKGLCDQVCIFVRTKTNAVSARSVQLDIDNGLFVALTVEYPGSISFANARHRLNQSYKQYELRSFAQNAQMGLWRNEKDGYSIQLTGDTNGVQILFICIQQGRRKQTGAVVPPIKE